MDRVKIEISWESLWRVLMFLVLVVVLFFGRHVLLGLFLAIVISSGLDRFVSYLESRGLPRVISAISIFVLGLFLVVLLLYLFIPLVIQETGSIITSLNESLGNVGFGEAVSAEAMESIQNLVSRITSYLFSPTGIINFGTVSQIVGGMGLALSVFISSFYLSLSRDGVARFLRAILPADYEEPALRIYERSRKQIALWFQTQIILSLVMGVLVWFALFMLGVKHALLLGILAAVFEIVPYIGPILAGATAVLVALSNSLTLALYVLVVFLAIQQFENHVLVPLLTRRAIGLHPVIVIVALLIGIEAGGFLGLLIAVPAAAVFQEVIDEWSVKKKGRLAV